MAPNRCPPRTCSGPCGSGPTALPRLDGPDRNADGQLTPFDRERVFPYSFRHTFAQRHADAGTPVDTPQRLLGHDTVRTTLGYYRVTAKRTRDAQDRLGPLQIDARAHRVRPGATALTDTEAAREQIGQVAVPFGICTEPSNVTAGGHSCPFRHRCTGCTYFRTDPSYTPELRGYLAQLLADRERLAAAVPALADWARADAAPSDAEIDAVRQLLRANDEVLTGLHADDRAAVEEAIAAIRTQRAALDITFPAELRGLTRPPQPVFFPTIERRTSSAETRMAEHTMAEHTSKLTELRRLDSADKTRRVLAALDTTISAGESLTIAALARRAGVSRRFIYDHPELRAEAERRSAQAADRRAGATTAERPTSPLRRSAPTWPTPKPPTTASTPNSRPYAAASAKSSATKYLATSAMHRPDPSTPNRATRPTPWPRRKTTRTPWQQELAAARQINRELIARLNREHRDTIHTRPRQPHRSHTPARHANPQVKTRAAHPYPRKGHESAQTTQIYLHADLALKEQALDRTTPPSSAPGRYQPPDPLLAFLETL